MMGDFDSSDDENVENLPPLPNDQVSWEYWQCCHDADANGESQFHINWLNLPLFHVDEKN